ncbi:MAG: helix-turn-helix domain-containing protein [Acidimicrobiia bacterium]|jgi:predicted DNA-binding transcriptional regulator YafY|nr:helix-turn-helix domain-containing protein [Acidimicrobiia bacterium]MCU0934861.1 helix-turn-helix domain-containing protein [Gammaproteobacteria bacterium]
MDDPHHITVAQAARALGVSERTVWRYLRAGRLAGETSGPAGAQRTLIDPGSVEQLQAEKGEGPALAAVRAERDRLVADLAAVVAERDALRDERDLLAERVGVLQRAVARPPRRRSIPGRGFAWAMLALARIR